MDLLVSIILGIVQGLTEFLPVSSSGHLELAKAIAGADNVPKESMLFTVVLHFATALSTLVIFRKEVAKIFKGLLQFEWNAESKFSVNIILSMIPAGIVGWFWEDRIEMLFEGQILLVGAMLLITGVLLFFADRSKKTNAEIGFLQAIVIGISQAIAILPGISRSGATISTTVLLGIDKEKAARFSFLMVVPLILGKMAKDMLSGKIDFNGDEIVPLAAGFVAAFVTGLLACTWMIALVKKSQLRYFSIYCFMVGIGAMIWQAIA